MSRQQHPTHDVYAQLAADVDQLVNPIRYTQPPHQWHWDRNRNRKPCTHPPVTVRYPPLLAQLAAAAYPASRGSDGGRRAKTTSRPPVNLDAVDRLVTIEQQIHGWRTRLGLPPAALRSTLLAFVGAAPTLAPSIADQLAGDVHNWRRWAATQAGWTLEDLE